MKKFLTLLMTLNLLLTLTYSAYAEEEVSSSEEKTEWVDKKQDQAIPDYLSQHYLQTKMEASDQIEAFKQKFREYRETDDYKKLLKEKPETENFIGYMSVAMNQLNSQVDQIYLIYLKSYQEELAEIEQNFEAGKLELTEEVAKFVSDYSLTEPKKVKEKEYSQEELFVHWKHYAYYKQTLDLSQKMEEMYQVYFSDIASLPKDQQGYTANREKIQAMYEDFISQLEFVEQLPESELKNIDEAETLINDKLDQLNQVSMEQAVKNQQIFEEE